jgi:hypothetical protein
MSVDQVLLTVLVTLLTTIVVILVAGGVLVFLVTRKIKARSIALRGGRGEVDIASTHSALVRVQKIAWLMDSSIPVGGGHRIGIDGLIDFVPGIGDVAGVLVSAYIIYLAAMCGAPESVLRRMTVNVLIDALLGAFPVLGVVADSAFKANIRNAAIFQEFVKDQERAGTVIDVESWSPTK